MPWGQRPASWGYLDQLVNLTLNESLYSSGPRLLCELSHEYSPALTTVRKTQCDDV